MKNLTKPFYFNAYLVLIISGFVIYYIPNFFTQLVTSVLVWASGVITAYGKGWVKYYFENKKLKEEKIDEVIGKILDSLGFVANNKTDLSDNFKYTHVNIRLRRCGLHIKKLGKDELGDTIINFMDTWQEYIKLTTKVKITKHDSIKKGRLLKDLMKLHKEILASLNK